MKNSHAIAIALPRRWLSAATLWSLHGLQLPFIPLNYSAQPFGL